MTEKIVVIGPALSQTGYGEQCRFALRSLVSRPDLFDVYIKPTNWGSSSWLSPLDSDRNWIDLLIRKTAMHMQSGGTFDVSLQVTIPNEWKKVAPMNIGYTAGIETTEVAPKWIENSFLMDKIITISNHSKEVFLGTICDAVNNTTGERVKIGCQTPIEVVHYPVRNYEAADISLDLEYDFNYLVMAQWGPRKNVEATIRWWIEEFQHEEVGLVIKTNLAKTSLIDRLHTEARIKSLTSAYPDKKCKVYLIHGNLTPEEITGLFHHPKIKSLVSLTHGEGFGLPLFEAAYNGLPIIAPNWSGHVDFLHAERKIRKNKKTIKKVVPCFAVVKHDLAPIPNEVVWQDVLIEGSKWCYPQEKSYKTQLRNVYKNYNRHLKIASTLRDHIHANFSEQKQYDLFANAVSSNPMVKVDVKDLPKISVITSVYNGDEFIRPFLEDITQQTIFDQCELILINANSPGNEQNVIDEYMAKYDNIVYKKLKKDPGIYGAWNKAIRVATGEYITNANLDDRHSPHFLETMAKALYTDPEVDMVYAHNLVTMVANETFKSNTANGRVWQCEPFSIEGLLRSNSPHCMPMWRRSLHDVNGFFNEKHRSASDWEFWLKCAIEGNAKYKKLGQVLGLYYFNPQGMSTNPEHNTWKREEEKEVFMKYKNLHRNKSNTGPIL
jgi:glycosyltransferase involved in cell wall biosynthesis